MTKIKNLPYSVEDVKVITISCMPKITDEYSRFPFAIPCPDVSSTTVILCSVFFRLRAARACSFGQSRFIYVRTRTAIPPRLRLAVSRTTPFKHHNNDRCKRYNGIILKTVQLATPRGSFRQLGSIAHRGPACNLNAALHRHYCNAP